MYAPTTELVDGTGNRVALTYLVTGKRLLSRKGPRLSAGEVQRISYASDPVSVTLVTAYGRRLTVAGNQRIYARSKKGKACWLAAKNLHIGALLYATTDGLLVTDKVTCLIQSENRREPWTTVSSTGGNLFAEEILCKAN